MPFQKGNKLWKRVEDPGRPPKYEDSLQLWKECQKYFDKANKSNFLTQKGEEVDEDGKPVLIARRGPFLLEDLCLHLKITRKTWSEWKSNRHDLCNVVEMAEQVIYSDKYKGSVLGIYHPRLLARDLGLVEKSETEVTVSGHEDFLRNLKPYTKPKL